jgi:CheY-like chemotaxis protein
MTSQQPTVPSPEPPVVLVIDDHDDSRTITRIVLEQAGYRVVEAADGSRGYETAMEVRPLVVLLDLVLPGIDGWEVARRLRRDHATGHAVIIALTAAVRTDDHERARLAGCDEVLTKPVLPPTMLATIRRYIGTPPRGVDS